MVMVLQMVHVIVTVLDCAGECGGDAIVDECGVCEGSGLDDQL